MSLKISEHGFIGNCRTGALINKNGEIAWCCLPHFDSASFFGSILDDEVGGSFSITPVGEFRSQQQYFDDTNVLQTKFHADSGSVLLLDMFTVRSQKEKRDVMYPSNEILRIVECLKGEMTLRFHFEPRANYGREKMKIMNRKKLGFKCEHKVDALFFQTTLPYENISNTGHSLAYEFKIKAGEKVIFSLCYSDFSPSEIPPLSEAYARLDLTIKFWQNWISKIKYKGPYLEQVKRSALALKLLSFAPSGAIIAAPTTSLPEDIGGIRNWDYRFCWLRDASFTVRSFLALGFTGEARAYVNWILHTTHLTKPRLQVLYTLYGESKVKEKIIPWLKGFQNSAPVRIGNAAELQFQLDVYGEVLNAIYYYLPSTKEFDQETKNFVLDLGKTVCKIWNCPDEGIWEPRSGRQHHVHSKVLAWVALDRIIKIANVYKWKAPTEKFGKIACEIRKDIEENGYNEQLKTYTHSYENGDLDAALLQMPLVEFCSANNEQMLHTTEEIKKHLSKNGLLYRYYSVDDGLPGDEGAFGICNFWMVQALAKAGKLEDAYKWFDNMLTYENPLGLWSEEIDPDTGEYLGNYPQAFSHVGLINAALTLDQESHKQGNRQ